MKSFSENPAVLAFFLWWLKAIPQDIIYITKRTIQKIYIYFSMDLLARTIFLPWKRDEINTSNLSLDLKFRVWMMNLVSRLVGAVVRSTVILIGMFSIVLTFVTSIVAIVGFVLLPLYAVYLLFSSFL